MLQCYLLSIYDASPSMIERVQREHERLAINLISARFYSAGLRVLTLNWLQMDYFARLSSELHNVRFLTIDRIQHFLIITGC